MSEVDERQELLRSHAESVNKSDSSQSRGSSAKSRDQSIKQILPVSEPHSKPAAAAAPGDQKTCWQRYKVWIIFGFIIILALAIGLGVGLSGSSEPPTPPDPGPGPGPDPHPPKPVVPDELNPYYLNKSSLLSESNLLQGKVIANMTKFNSLMEAKQADQKVIKATPRNIPQGLNNQLFSQISFEFRQVSYQMTRAVFSPAEVERFSIPESLSRDPETMRSKQTMRLDFTGAQLINDPFGFKFVDPKDGTPLLTTFNQTFVMYDKYMQLDLFLPSQRVFGLGERSSSFQLGEGAWTMWANGQEKVEDDGSGGLQSFGVHPFIMVQTQKPQEFMGIYFRNANAQSPVIRYKNVTNCETITNMTDGTNTTNCTSSLKTLFSYITTGGQIEAYFMFKDNARGIIKMYQNMVGKPTLPPFWSLGWHAVSNATNQSQLETFVNKWSTFPLEGIWLGTDYMKKDFSVNTQAFPSLKNLTQQLQSQGKKVMLTVGAGISSADRESKFFSKAHQENLLLKSAVNTGQDDGILTQSVWQNDTVFLDFLSKGAKEVWAQGLMDLWDSVPFDGLWLDMNEATGLCNGECPQGKQGNLAESDHKELKGKVKRRLQDLAETDQEIKNFTWWFSYQNQNESKSTYYLPFIPGSWNLDNMSLSLNATHPSTNETEYNLHSLFGHSQGKTTFEVLSNSSDSPLKDKRLLLLSRSTFSGSGQYVQHTGIPFSSWESMKTSIAGSMNFNMFGIPLSASDITSFAEDEQLERRWAQLAMLLPFARHRGVIETPQSNWSTLYRDAMFDRLQYVRHIYTCLFEASRDGGTCFDPLFYDFSDVNSTFKDIEHTFLVGGAYKVSPVLHANATEITSFFPNGRWVNMKNFSHTIKADNQTLGGEFVTFDSSDGTVHLKPGRIGVFQDNIDRTKNSTQAMNDHGGIQLIINKHQGLAEGSVFLDDGESMSQLETEQFEHYQLVNSQNTLNKLSLNEKVSNSTGFYVEKVVVSPAVEDESEMIANTACFITNNGSALPLKVEYGMLDQKVETLIITAMDGQDPRALSFFDMNRIHYQYVNGSESSGVNFCNLPQSYHTLTSDFDGSNNQATLDFTGHDILNPSQTTLNLRILESGVLNLHWNFKNQQDSPFEVPREIIDVDRTKLKEGAKLSDFISVTKQDLSISVLKNGVKQFELLGFILDKYFNFFQVTAHTATSPASGLIGAIEQVQSSLFLEDGYYSFWPRDEANPPANHKLPNTNQYTENPFFMAKSQNGWFGVLINNAGAQDWKIRNNWDGTVNMNVSSSSGLGDLFIMLGDTAEEVIRQYHQGVVGTPVKVPQWSLGWGQSRWGYFNTSMMQEVIGNYSSYGLPLDMLFSDIDYLDRYRDFTYDKDNFKQLPDLVSDLKSKNVMYLPITDAGISKRSPDQNYSAYNEGVEKNVFIKHAKGGIFTGRVWPGDVAFVDWFNPNTTQWWHDQLDAFHQQLPFSGFWLDMNEVTNYCTGTCYDEEKADIPVKSFLQYIPTGRDLEWKTASIDAYHYTGRKQLETHSLYGTMMTRATQLWFQKKQQRTVLVSRNIFAGHGKFGSRWMGDNFSTQEQMGRSVTGIYQHNIMGIPLVGGDICGFAGDTTPELCARWYTLGAFYTWSRNHKVIDHTLQEPYLFAEQIYENSISYLDVIKKAMWTKFIFVKQMYSAMLELSEQGGSLHRPLFFEFDQDPSAYYADQENNIMLGDSIKLSVNSKVLGQNYTEFYFPEGIWCNILQPNETNTCFNFLFDGHNATLRTKAYDAYAHLREGHLAVLQDGKNIVLTHNKTTTTDLNEFPVQLHINPLCAGPFCSASGLFHNDDGVVFDNTNKLNSYNLSLSSQDRTKLTLTVSHLKVASDLENNRTNMADQVNVVRLYNAASLTLNTAFGVSVTFTNSTVVNLADATYNRAWDALEFTNTDKDNLLWLPEIKNIEFTRK